MLYLVNHLLRSYKLQAKCLFRNKKQTISWVRLDNTSKYYNCVPIMLISGWRTEKKNYYILLKTFHKLMSKCISIHKCMHSYIDSWRCMYVRPLMGSMVFRLATAVFCPSAPSWCTNRRNRSRELFVRHRRKLQSDRNGSPQSISRSSWPGTRHGMIPMRIDSD